MKRRNRKLHSAWLLAGALSPVLSGPAAAKGMVQSAFAAPSSPVMLTRELRKVIAPGVEIVSRRSYELRFVREGEGWRVDGTLVVTEVEAPAELAPLAAIEKARKDDGLFPLRLNAQGYIVAQAPAADLPAAEKAKDLVNSSVEKIAMPREHRSVATQMVQRIVTQSRVVGPNWPADLFRPGSDQQTHVQEVPLPDGRQGKVTVTLQASQASGGLLDRFERRVLTELDGTRRLSLETWRMVARD
ncbi:hypothetical protein [Novosphingobium sp. TH158]|uniref:hypothetical protein n=1 Tax=Novosphingobium sp. TH158 TaxID=2067455 RepID=UPI000C7CC19A|nr:hypothetical protein [Novosphingobium sp. TH158]PLK27242.1 hypothetical protein C0V78_10345 [Novosphingobium sp. TH158]